MWLLAALTVTTSAASGCPDGAALVERLGRAGVEVGAADDVRVRFAIDADGRRVAEVEVPGGEPRRIEHEGADCASLADATVALLGVLLAARPAPPPPPPPPPTPVEEPPALRVDGALLASSGIVASFALGAGASAAYRPVRWASLGGGIEAWPSRDHAVAGGSVSLAAATLALAACFGGAWKTASLEGCALAHGGLYALSASGFPVESATTRALWAAEADVRGALAIVGPLRAFVRVGVWAPLTRLDVAVRGTEPAFSTTSFAPKGAFGIELDR